MEIVCIKSEVHFNKDKLNLATSFLLSRTLQVQKRLAQSTTTKGGRSNQKKVGIHTEMCAFFRLLLMLHRLFTSSCWCRAPADRPAAGSVSAGGGAESLAADLGHQSDPGPRRSTGRLHGGAAPLSGQTAGKKRYVLRSPSLPRAMLSL